jgi:Kef-type K+ transport system membrane component KefB
MDLYEDQTADCNWRNDCRDCSGPSLVGMYFPEFSAFLFQKNHWETSVLSQIGLILFMYIVGMELDLSVLRKKAHDAVVISHASIIIPFALGIGLSYFIYQEFAPKEFSLLLLLYL